MYGSSWHAMRSFYRDSAVTRQRVKPGTVRRIMTYARPYRWDLALFLGMNALAAVAVVAVPLLLKTLIDQGILARNTGVVIAMAAVVAGSRAGQRAPVLRPALVLRQDRRGADLRPAHRGVRARPAAADRLLYPGPDRDRWSAG